MKLAELAGWIPIRLYWESSRLMVDWCYRGTTRLSEPFFDQTVERCLSNPFNLLFRHQTPVEVLGEWQAGGPASQPTGFIFHMSRCGSTLISQMLAALPQNLVVSEAGTIDTVLRSNLIEPSVTDDQRIQWLQWLVSALGQRYGQEKHYFVKFDSWHTLELPLIKRAFPNVPWVFVYREPIEVIVSNLKRTTGRMFPGPLGASLLGLDPSTIFEMQREEYSARMVARFCEVALEHYGSGALLINYRQLPDVVFDSLLDFFEVDYSAADRDLMFNASQFDAKDPTVRFVNDDAAKTREATDPVRQMADRWVKEPYEELEAARRASVTADKLSRHEGTTQSCAKKSLL